MSDLTEAAREAIQKEGLPVVPEPKTNLPLYISIRELPLRFQFGTSKINKFFEGLKDGKIYMTKCNKCGEGFFPPQADCPKCIDTDMKWIPLDGEGELVTCTMIFVKPSTYMHYDNYVVGIAQMKEGVRVLAWLRIADPTGIKPRMKVRLQTTTRKPEGILTYEFVPL